MADFKIDDTVDITTVVCPTTFVKAKVAASLFRTFQEALRKRVTRY